MFGQITYYVVGIIVALIVVGGLLYIFYSRSNAVEKTGSGALIMLAIVSLMIPIFWIVEGNNQAQAKTQQHDIAVDRGMALYAQYCIVDCYTIVNDKIVNPTYNGYTISDLNGMSDNNLMRVIDGGVFNPAKPQPTNPNALVTGQDFGGPLSTTDVAYLFAFLRSADPAYLSKNGFDPKMNAFNQLPNFLQNGLVVSSQETLNGNTAAYATAVALGKVGQFGTPVDMTKSKNVTINILDNGSGMFKYDPINVQVKVGTVITWVNKSSAGHTVTAIAGDGSNTNTKAPQIFDSGASKLIGTGQTFTYTVTNAAYTFNANHTVVYYCQVHPMMLAELTIVQ
ncbi:MAG TPA: hypothetical protein DHW02_17070 [Ktedonobacter sp.]|nr:hypothetical protein [Ktedonobacter sp.]